MSKMKMRVLSMLMVVGLAGTLTACGTKSEEASTSEAKKKPVIALSNSYYGNTWRHQMVDSFEAAAKEAKAKGEIADYIILNGDGSQNQQITQMNDLILKKVDAIAIDSASPTALNGVIAKAQQAGIKVVSFDSVATDPNAYKLSFNFKKYGTDAAQYMADKLGGKGNVILVRGVAGSAPDNDMYEGQMEVLKKYPDIKVVSTVYGQATTSVAQQQISSVLPSLPQVDGVVTQGGGDAYGTVQAYEALKRPVPPIIGDGTAEFMKWWGNQNRANGYETLSICSTPGIGGAAFWLTLNILNGADVPKETVMPLVEIGTDELSKYQDMQPNTIASPTFDDAWVKENIIKKK